MNFDALSPDWNAISATEITGLAQQLANNTLLLPTNDGPLLVSLHSFGARLRFGVKSFGEYQMLLSEPESAPIKTETDEGKTLISGAGHTILIQHAPFSFELRCGGRTVTRSTTDGHFVRKFRMPPVAKVNGGWLVSLDLDVSEPVYGLGEKWGKLDKRGQLIRSYNHDALGVNAEISYKNTPFCWSPNGWGAFVHTPAPVTHAVGFASWSQRTYGIFVEDGSADLFLFSGDNGAKQLNTYTELTGRAPSPPQWSLGVILSKAYYQDAQELLATAKAVREKNMPCDVITLDGRAWQDTDTRFAFEWDPSRYPDPKAIMDALKALHFKVCIWEYPLVSVANPLFKTMSDKGWLLTNKKTGETYRYQWDMSCFGKVLTPLPESGIVDFTHPEAFAFWRDSHKPLFDLGVDMIKADFGEQIESDMQAHNGDCGDVLHNTYTLLYNRCVYEAAERYCKSGPFLFSRSSWTGSQRYPAQWGGDPQADWGGLAGSIRGGLSWGLSGAPFYATDIGGFYSDERNAELYVRWAQAAVFSAHMRLHGIGQREPWSYGPEAESAVNKALKLRYSLLPYISEAMSQSCVSGLPVQRAMALSCPNEKIAWAFEDQFFFGEHMLVAPALRPGGNVEVYLPKTIATSWRRFPCNTHFVGGELHQLNLKLDEIAVFVPEGIEIPLGPELEYIADTNAKPKTIRSWPNS